MILVPTESIDGMSISTPMRGAIGDWLEEAIQDLRSQVCTIVSSAF